MSRIHRYNDDPDTDRLSIVYVWEKNTNAWKKHDNPINRYNEIKEYNKKLKRL